MSAPDRRGLLDRDHGWLSPAPPSPARSPLPAWMNDVFIERLWRSLKREDIYLKGYADGREAKAGIAAWFAFHNARRPHQALGDRAPMAVWRSGVTGGDTAVDMTLVLRTSLANAGALPTCPQPPQQQQEALIA